jgi:hypothetical protein
MKSILLPANAPSFMPLFRNHCSLIYRRTELLSALWEKNDCAGKPRRTLSSPVLSPSSAA